MFHLRFEGLLCSWVKVVFIFQRPLFLSVSKASPTWKSSQRASRPITKLVPPSHTQIIIATQSLSLSLSLSCCSGTMMTLESKRTRRRTTITGSITILFLFLLQQIEAEGTVWREVLPKTPTKEFDRDTPVRKGILWFGGSINDDVIENRKQEKNSKEEQQHPLRTDLWKLKVSWMGRKERVLRYPKILQIEFDPNGYCRLYTNPDDNNNESTTTISDIGTWKVFPWGVCFQIHHDGWDYTFNADLHLNPFGKYPKLMQGTIKKYPNSRAHQDDDEQDNIFVKKRQKWFQKNVGSFSAEGTGVDKFDFEYIHRGYGLHQ